MTLSCLAVRDHWGSPTIRKWDFFLSTFPLPSHKPLGESSNKSGQVRLAASPPLYDQIWCSFDLVIWLYVFWNEFYTKKSISTQLPESPIPPLNAATLPMIICKRLAPPYDHLQEAGPSVSSFARGRPLQMTICKRSVPSDHHLQGAGPSFWQLQKGHEKCIFETLHNEIKCVLSVKESNFNENIARIANAVQATISPLNVMIQVSQFVSNSQLCH